jgi:protocatechuate 3,4-dioxygenase, beta subunit
MRSTGWMLSLLLLACPVSAVAEEPIVGGPCEGCEAVFQGLPEEIGWETRLAPEGEPGEPLVLEGVVRGVGGEPVPGVIVYAYHTDAEGIYPRDSSLGGAARRHGRLRGWAKSDAEGRYRFVTVRPGSYPSTRIAQHVHLHVIEPGRCTYWIADVNFTDDPFLGARHRRGPHRGGTGVVTPTRDPGGAWRTRRDIVLGEAVPGYERCGTDG